VTVPKTEATPPRRPVEVAFADVVFVAARFSFMRSSIMASLFMPGKAAAEAAIAAIAVA
jgi:hypothetical protein